MLGSLIVVSYACIMKRLASCSSLKHNITTAPLGCLSGVLEVAGHCGEAQFRLDALHLGACLALRGMQYNLSELSVNSQ